MWEHHDRRVHSGHNARDDTESTGAGWVDTSRHDGLTWLRRGRGRRGYFQDVGGEERSANQEREGREKGEHSLEGVSCRGGGLHSLVGVESRERRGHPPDVKTIEKREQQQNVGGGRGNRTASTCGRGRGRHMPHTDDNGGRG